MSRGFPLGNVRNLRPAPGKPYDHTTEADRRTITVTVDEAALIIMALGLQGTKATLKLVDDLREQLHPSGGAA